MKVDLCILVFVFLVHSSQCSLPHHPPYFRIGQYIQNPFIHIAVILCYDQSSPVCTVRVSANTCIRRDEKQVAPVTTPFKKSRVPQGWARVQGRQSPFHLTFLWVANQNTETHTETRRVFCCFFALAQLCSGTRLLLSHNAPLTHHITSTHPHPPFTCTFLAFISILLPNTHNLQIQCQHQRPG